MKLKYGWLTKHKTSLSVLFKCSWFLLKLPSSFGYNHRYGESQMCQLSPAYISILVSTPFPNQSSVMILVMETHGRWPRGEFSCGNTPSSSLLAWRHVDFTKLQFWTFIFKVRNIQFVHEITDRQASSLFH